jgi:hypothetical protein
MCDIDKVCRPTLVRYAEPASVNDDSLDLCSYWLATASCAERAPVKRGRSRRPEQCRAGSNA